MHTFTDNLLFTTADLGADHDAVNERPLYEAATQLLAKALRERSTEDLSALISDLHKDNRLCISPTRQGADT